MDIDLSTRYLGLKLANPVIIGACPLGDSIDAVSRFADGGAAAIVLHSLFEEPVDRESLGAPWSGTSADQGEQEFLRTVGAYVAHIAALKRRVDIPVIASINGRAAGPWLSVIGELAAAGADALELNTYHVATQSSESAESVEGRLVELVARVKAQAGPLAVSVKLSPFYSSLPHLAARLEAVGADGLVLFNRFYRSDFDVETMRMTSKVQFSDSTDLPVRLRWLSVLATCYHGSLACSGGVHATGDTLKALFAGAHAVQLVSAAIKRGPSACAEIVKGLAEWMEKQGYATIDEIRDALNPRRLPPVEGAARLAHMRTLRAYDPWEHLR